MNSLNRLLIISLILLIIQVTICVKCHINDEITCKKTTEIIKRTPHFNIYEKNEFPNDNKLILGSGESYRKGYFTLLIKGYVREGIFIINYNSTYFNNVFFPNCNRLNKEFKCNLFIDTKYGINPSHTNISLTLIDITNKIIIDTQTIKIY